MIYRGYDIEHKDLFWHVTLNGVWLHKDVSEDAAMSWVDAHKRKVAANKGA